MTAQQTNSVATLHAELVQKLLDAQSPLYPVLKALAGLNEETKAQFEKTQARRDSEHARLSALSLPELQAMKERQTAHEAAAEAKRAEVKKRQQLDAAAKEAKKEAAKFYNQDSATADFQHWSKMDHWTLDESLALLLGKDPRVLTRAAMESELSPGWGLMFEPQRERTGFLQAYENLRHLAERAAAMRAPQLRPEQVLLWAHQSGAIPPPADLVKGVLARVQRSNAQRAQNVTPSSNAASREQEIPDAPAEKAATSLKRAALVKAHRRNWPTIDGDLGHANENGLSASAKAPTYGHWFEDKALDWARQNGKLTGTDTASTNAAHRQFGPIHRHED